MDYRQLFRSIPGLYLVLSPELVMLEASDALLHAVGRRRQELLDRNLFDVFPDDPGDPAANGVRNLRSSLERVLRERLPDAMAVQKHPLRRPPEEGGEFGERYWSPLNVPMLGPDGEVVCIIHRVEEVTEFVRLLERSDGIDGVTAEIFQRAHELQEANRELREARIRESEAERRASEILGSIKDAVFTLDREWRFTFLNDEAVRRLRRNREELLGRSLWDEFPALIGTVFEQRYRQALAEGRTVSFEAIYEPFGAWVSVRAYPSAEGLSIYFLDITERKQVEAAAGVLLRELEERDRLLAIAGRTARLGGWLVDLVTGTLHWTDEVCAIHDVPPGTQVSIEEAIDFYAPEWRQVIAEHVAACIDAGTPYDLELEVISRKGRRVWVRTIGEAVRGPGGTITRIHGSFQDITERKRAERALQESEERFRQLAAHTDAVFWMQDITAGRTIYVSPAFERVWGRPPGELLGRRRAWAESVLPEDRERVLAKLDRTPDAAYELEYRIARPDGEIRWIRDRGFPVADAQGRVYRTAGIAEDITERRQAELERAAVEAHYRRLVETSPDGIIALDLEGRFTEINPAAAELAGRPAGTLLGRHLTEVIAPEDQAEVTRVRNERLATGRDVLDYEVRIVRPSGERRLVRLRTTVIRDAGVVIGTHGIVRDITEERAREEEMRLLAAALEELDEGVSVTRSDGQIVYANAMHARLLGYDRGRQPLPNSREFMSEAEWGREEEILGTVARQGIWVGRVERHRLDTGQAVPVEMIMGRVETDGMEGLFLSILRDVSEEIERERHLRRAERLASVGTLIGGVAHELNNPLHAIRNFAELLMMEPRSTDDREALEIIQREADRAAKVVSDLRLFARETQEVEGGRVAVDLNDVVRHVLKVRRYSLGTRNIEVREDLADDLPPVLADRGNVEQVVLNLTVNAEQAMAEQSGERRLILRTRRTPGGAALHVVDSGPGIPPQYLERVFDPFFTTKAPGEGTGLGLSLVHNIVTEHGGAIHVDSQVGKGTAFRIELPRAPGEKAGAAEGTVAAPKRALRVLVVDDEVAVRRVSVRFLEHLGHVVETASDGAEALELLAQREYDVIVSDLRMPGLSGEEFLQRLREDERGLERRLIFVTGDAASTDAARVVADAGVPVLVKPVRLQELGRVIEYAAGAGGTGRDRTPPFTQGR
jgi:PAS domain S-box-containing protein